MTDNTKEQEFEALKQGILDCRRCEDLFGFEPHPIFLGRMDSTIMQISQAPSRTVYRTRKPFDDASGRKLRQEWYRISDDVFYDPANFYIVSMAHCYPGKSPHGGDRLPPKSCADRWLRREMELVNNRIFLVVGRIAADYLFPKQNFPSLVFQDQQLGGKPAYVLPHPSPLNIKWFRDHPEFLDFRIKEISAVIHQVLELPNPKE